MGVIIKLNSHLYRFGTESRNLGYKYNDHANSLQDVASKVF